jgi:hypothetical protein
VTRWWTDVVAVIDDLVGLPLAIVALLLAAVLVGVLLYTFPAWVPTRWPHRPRWRPATWWRRLVAWRPGRRRRPAPDLVEPPVPAEVPPADDRLPDLPAATFVSIADRLAAEGRYAEAVRERMRAMVRDLIDQRVVGHLPGWTVTELATAAAAARPEVSAPVTAASGIFSDLWYGLRPARREHDERMRALAGELAGVLDPTAARNGGRP